MTVNTISYKSLVGFFYQIYSFDAIGDKDELIGLWCQKVKGQGHSETTYGQMSTAFSRLSPECMYMYVF